MDSAKLFKNGQSQAVRLPKEYRFEGDEVYITRLDNAVILLPKNDPWRSLVGSLSQFTPDFLESREQPGYQEREPIA